MNKRSALVLAAGLFAALMVGAAAMSFGLSGNDTAQASLKEPKPIVKTVHRTITVHRDAKATTEPQVVRVVGAPSSSSSSTSSSSDDQYGDSSDDQYGDSSDDQYGDSSDDQYEAHSSDSSSSTETGSDSSSDHEDD